MTCEKAGEVTAKTRSKFLQLGAIFRTYAKVRRYLLYLSKQLYNPQASHDGLLSMHFPLRYRDGLYYCDTDVYTVDRDPVRPTCARTTAFPTRTQTHRPAPKFVPTTRARQVESEVWALWFGSPGEGQLDALPHHVDGIPPVFEYHPFRHIDFKEQAYIRKQPPRKSAERLPDCGSEFFMDFGFMRASTDDYRRPNKTTDQVVQLYDGYSAYLLIVDGASRRVWVFLTTGKNPPIAILRAFLTKFGLAKGVIRTNQGGELARSDAFRTTMMDDFGYTIEPTGADSPSQNGGAEIYNGTLAVKVHTLLYGSGLPAKFWSAALLHSVYLYNRLVHSSVGMTPYEAWYGRRPDMTFLKTFGSKVCVRQSGSQRCKLDRHDFTRIFLGYIATDQNMMYLDTTSVIVKTCHHAVFDEVWYLQPTRPPAAQLLYDLGIEAEDELVNIHGPLQLTPQGTITPITIPWPPPPPISLPKKIWDSPSSSLYAPLPLRLTGARIDKWRSRIRGAWLMSIGDMAVSTLAEVQSAIRLLSQRHAPSCLLTFTHPEISPDISHNGLPIISRDDFSQLTHDQLNNRLDLLATGPRFPRVQKYSIVESGDVRQYVTRVMRLTRGRLLKQDDWTDWQESEYLQLNQYWDQGCLGMPVAVDHNDAVFHLVWTYNIKAVDGRKKARCVCDGSSRSGSVKVLDEVYANCVDQTSAHLFYAVAAAENLLVFGSDVCNAFAEALPPKQGFYIRPDRAFNEWWVNFKGHPPIPPGHVIPVLSAMQGHPESPRLWEKHADAILRDIGLTPTIHEPCLYSGTINGTCIILMRQVDDFAIAAPDQHTADILMDLLDDQLTMPIKRQGLLDMFNGVDVVQTKHYIKLDCHTYIEKLSAKYLATWMNKIPLSDNRPTPLPSDADWLRNFNAAIGSDNPKELATLEKTMQMKYRGGVGELIWAMTTCRPDIAFTSVKLSQSNSRPAEIHYHGLKHAIRYLYTTKTDGLYYWRTHPRPDLPDLPLPAINSNAQDLLLDNRPDHEASIAVAYGDSDWATCVKTRRSFSGICIQLAGGTIAYKTKFQPTVALSSTEAEFMAACDVGRMSLYIRSILWDLDIPQEAATIAYEDNDGCTAMANAQKPTSRTRHIDIKYFALCDWVESDLIHLERIDTSINIADHLTKPLSRILFHRHADFLLGHVPPKYSPVYQQAITTYSNKFDEAIDKFIPESFTTPMTAKAARIHAPTYDDIRGNPWLIILWHD